MAFIYKSTNEPQGIHSGSAVATLLGVSPEGSPVEVTADSFVRAASIVPLSGNPTLADEGATGLIVPTVNAMKKYIADVGVIGDTGPRGYQGPQGEDGPQGPRGYQGDKGNDGTSVTIVGQLEDDSELPDPFDSDYKLGDGFLINGDLWVLTYDKSSGKNEWDNVGRIQGPQGVKGDQGATGPQGVTGTFNSSDWDAIVNLFYAHGIKLEEGTISVTQKINAANGFFQVNNV